MTEETRVRAPAKKLPRGVFEKHRGSGIYWIRYASASGRERREKVGPHIKAAVTLYQKRKTEAFEDRKLRPEVLAPRTSRTHHAAATQSVDWLQTERVIQTLKEAAQALSNSIDALQSLAVPTRSNKTDA
jgi:hypothetical protein